MIDIREFGRPAGCFFQQGAASTRSKRLDGRDALDRARGSSAALPPGVQTTTLGSASPMK